MRFSLVTLGWVFVVGMPVIAIAEEKTYEIKQPTGTWQVPGEFQVPGDIQKAGAVDGCSVTLTAYADTLFEFDKSVLAKGAEKPLQQSSDVIQTEKKLQRLRIRGHTDAKGPDAYNDKLSKERAVSVREWLATRLPANLPVSVEGAGEREPIKPNTKPDGSDNPEGRALNRRVEIILELCKEP